MKRAIGVICLLLLVPLVGGCWLFQVPPDPLPVDLVPPELRDVVFAQVDWYESDGTSVQANSLYGQMSWSYFPDATTTFYLSVAAALEAGAEATWIVQNLPLFADDNGDASSRRESVYFNLADLGLTFDDPMEQVFGIDVQEMVVNILVTAEPVLDLPDVVEGIRSVGTTDHWASGTPDESPEPGPLLDPGEPQSVRIHDVATRLNASRDVRSVQEATAKCCAGAFARSIDWLNRKYHLGIDKTAQRIYEELITAGVSRPNTDRSPARDEWIARKNAYARQLSGNKIVTKVWDRGTDVAPVAGVTEETGDLLEWLAGEIGTEDVELAYFYPGNAHIVTVLELYVAGTNVFVKYRDDERQGDNSRGDTTVKHAQIYKKDGQYRFGSDRNIIYFAVSESVVTPQPDDGATPGDPPCEGE